MSPGSPEGAAVSPAERGGAGVPASLWSRWVALLDRTEAATSLALVRIALGLIVAAHVARQWWGTPPLYWFDRAHGGFRHLDDPGILGWFGGATPEVIAAFSLAAGASGLVMAIGWQTRAAMFATWFTWRALADLNPHSGGSYDELIKNILFVLLISGAGHALSLDARGRPARAVAAWPRWLLVGQLVLVYWMTGLQKVSDSWVPGGELDALWYILQQPTWVRRDLDMQALAPFFPVTQVMTLSVWLWEQCGPLLLIAAWFRHTRTRAGRLRAWFNRVDVRVLYLLFGLGMHAGIEALMDVGAFSTATASMYFACFHPDELRAWWRRKPARKSSPT